MKILTVAGMVGLLGLLAGCASKSIPGEDMGGPEAGLPALYVPDDIALVGVGSGLTWGRYLLRMAEVNDA